MTDHLFQLNRKPGISLQKQIREMLVSAIHDRHLPYDAPLPSSRKMSEMLQVSRNTVMLVYEQLLADGYLISKERSGYYVNTEFIQELMQAKPDADNEPTNKAQFDWETLFSSKPSQQENLHKPRNWRDYEYPFIFGQIDAELFPLAEWRDCTRQATSTLFTKDWLGDYGDADDDQLIEQLKNRVFPRRGVHCHNDEILLTLGTQHSLYLLATLLGGKDKTLGMENPGYRDAMNIFEHGKSRIKLLEVDDQGVDPKQDTSDCDFIFLTPSHQAPTTVTLPKNRRIELLAKAQRENFVIIEDDYESEFNFFEQPSPAIKSMDEEGRVIYVGSLSKTLSPGLRIGYIVAGKKLITELRALRRLMLRHPPTNNQLTLALFLAEGYHDTMIRRLTHVYRERYGVIQQAIAKHLPDFKVAPSQGGSASWLKGPNGFSATQLQQKAHHQSVFIESGKPHFFGEDRPDNYFRLGYSAIPTAKISKGIEILGPLID